MAGIPATLLTILNTPDFTLADLRTTDRIAPARKNVGVYTRLYQEPHAAPEMYVESTNNIFVRNEEYSRAIKWLSSKGRHYVKGVKCGNNFCAILICDLPNDFCWNTR